MLRIVWILLVLLLLGLLPVWPYSTEWGYVPGGTVAIVLLVLVLLAVTKKL